VWRAASQILATETRSADGWCATSRRGHRRVSRAATREAGKRCPWPAGRGPRRCRQSLERLARRQRLADHSRTQSHGQLGGASGCAITHPLTRRTPRRVSRAGPPPALDGSRVGCGQVSVPAVRPSLRVRNTVWRGTPPPGRHHDKYAVVHTLPWAVRPPRRCFAWPAATAVCVPASKRGLRHVRYGWRLCSPVSLPRRSLPRGAEA